MRSEDLHFGFFPALPLRDNLELGEWVVGSPAPEVEWASSEFRQLAETLYDSFAPRFTRGAKLWHRTRGFDGSWPTAEAYRAIQAAVAFAVFDVNDHVPVADRQTQLATTDNADLFLQPIHDRITHVRPGGLRGEWIGGWPIGEGAPPLADAVFPLQLAVPASKTLAKAVYDFLCGGSANLARVATAMEWHRVAMANPAAVTLQQRIVALKTGFEALLNESSSVAAAGLLRRLFEDATRDHQKLLPWEGVLWSPTERTISYWWWEREKNEKIRVLKRCSELEHWFLAFANARNEVIHDGVLSSDVYVAPAERPKSRYAGSLFWTGERVLREAIKTELGSKVLLCGIIAADERIRAAVGPSLDVDNPVNLTATVGPSATTPVTPLLTMLRSLGCRAANEITICDLFEEGARPGAVARATTGRHIDPWDSGSEEWGVDPEEKWIEITGAERELLKQAGAEDELPNLWYPCE